MTSTSTAAGTLEQGDRPQTNHPSIGPASPTQKAINDPSIHVVQQRVSLDPLTSDHPLAAHQTAMLLVFYLPQHLEESQLEQELGLVHELTTETSDGRLARAQGSGDSGGGPFLFHGPEDEATLVGVQPRAALLRLAGWRTARESLVQGWLGQSALSRGV